MDLDINRTPGFGIGRVSYLLQNEIRYGLNQLELELSPEGLSILLLLCSVGKPIRVTDLAMLALRDGTTLKRQIDGLVKLGFVVQKQDESDRRCVLISCTRQGLDAVELVAPTLQAIRERALGGISAKDTQTSTKVLNQIRNNLLADGSEAAK
jgi:MarR family transcriptional regulator for hemolysin